MEQLKGACIIGQSGGPTSVINASAQGVIQTALASPKSPGFWGLPTASKGCWPTNCMTWARGPGPAGSAPVHPLLRPGLLPV